MPELRLVPETRETCHAFFRRLVQDPALFAEGEAFVPYCYDEAAVDARFDALQRRQDKKSYALLLCDTVIGNVELKHLDTAAGSCELGICLTDDSVKNRGFGTVAVYLARRIAFDELGLERITAKCLKTNPRSLRMLEKSGFYRVGEDTRFDHYNDYMMAKSRKAFRRAALRRSKTALLFCHIFIAMSIGRMIQRIIRCQTCRLAAKSIESSIDFAIRKSL